MNARYLVTHGSYEKYIQKKEPLITLSGGDRVFEDLNEAGLYQRVHNISNLISIEDYKVGRYVHICDYAQQKLDVEHEVNKGYDCIFLGDEINYDLLNYGCFSVWATSNEKLVEFLSGVEFQAIVLAFR